MTSSVFSHSPYLLTSYHFRDHTVLLPYSWPGLNSIWSRAVGLLMAFGQLCVSRHTPPCLMIGWPSLPM